MDTKNQYCNTCPDNKDCGYRTRNLERKCEKLSIYIDGWNAAKEEFKKLVEDNIELAYDSGQQANLLEDLLKEI